MVERGGQPSVLIPTQIDGGLVGNPYPHLCAAARAVVDRDDDARVAFINEDYWIWAPKTKRILARVDELVPIIGQTRPECFMVVAEPNMGKSMTIRKIMSEILPLHEPSFLREHSGLFHSASNGRFGRTVLIARKCAIATVRSSARRITREVLVRTIETWRNDLKFGKPANKSVG